MEDKASEDFWTNHWKELPVPKEFSPSDHSVSNFPNIEYHDVFEQIFRGKDLSKLSILEVGCANSVFLPYFKKQFGLTVYGLDYSEYGCTREETILNEFNVDGTIIHGDMFEPPIDLIGKFDFVFSNGVIEHFENTLGAFNALKLFLNDNGILITAIPSMKGINGQLIRLLNKPVYDIHVPLTAKDLATATLAAGFKKTENKLVITPSLYIPLNEVDEVVRMKFLLNILNKFLIIISRFFWWIQLKFNFRIRSHFFTNMIINIAYK